MNNIKNFIYILLNNEFKNYFIGFIFSFILTIIPFFIILQKIFLRKDILFTIIFLCSIVQILIHLIYFLHINFSYKKIWYLLSLIFTFLIIIILISGTIWIMGHLNQNLMN